MDTIKINPSEDPATIIVNIIKREDEEIENNFVEINMKIDININSNLNSKVIIFFRHHHKLVILIKIIVLKIFIKEIFTSKVSVLLN